MKLQLIIDERERKVIPLIQAMIKDYSMEIDVVVDTIPLGDFIIKCDDKEVLIIERKCLSDLASSIKDGALKDVMTNFNCISQHDILFAEASHEKLTDEELADADNEYNKIIYNRSNRGRSR